MNSMRLRYIELVEKSHNSRPNAIKIVMRETEFKGTEEDMAEIVLTPTKEEQLKHIQKYRLTCDRCKTNEYLVAEPVVYDYKGDLIDTVEYYCGNPNEDSSIFSKCWNHVQAYENRKGENRSKLIQEKV